MDKIIIILLALAILILLVAYEILRKENKSIRHELMKREGQLMQIDTIRQTDGLLLDGQNFE